MLTFDPPDLQTQVTTALDELEEIIYHSWYRLNDPSVDLAKHDDVITLSTIVDECTLSTAEHSTLEVTVGDLLSWAETLRRYELRERTLLRMDNLTLAHIEPLGEDEYAFLESVVEGRAKTEQSVTVEGAAFSVRLRCGFTPFALFIEREGRNDDHHASWYENTPFVEVQHPSDASDATVKAVIDAYLYELASSSSLFFQMSPYISVELWDEETPRRPHKTLNLRPISLGRGLQELHRLFVAGCSAQPVEYALIHFVKVIEYVSATVVRMTRHEALRRRLSGPRALSPDATFLDDLSSLIEDQRVFAKDSEALKLAVQTCCDALLLAAEAPKFLTQLRSLKESDEPKKKRSALEEFSTCLSATRNQLSHAKASYQLTGAECPAEQLIELTACARLAADQVIRWFSQLPSNARVI